MHVICKIHISRKQKSCHHDQYQHCASKKNEKETVQIADSSLNPNH